MIPSSERLPSFGSGLRVSFLKNLPEDPSISHHQELSVNHADQIAPAGFEHLHLNDAALRLPDADDLVWREGLRENPAMSATASSVSLSFLMWGGRLPTFMSAKRSCIHLYKKRIPIRSAFEAMRRDYRPPARQQIPISCLILQLSLRVPAPASSCFSP